MNMTSRQSWAIFTMAKIDVRKTAISMEKASQLIASLKAGGNQFDAAIAEMKTLPGVEIKGEAKPKQDWLVIYREAEQKGHEAVSRFEPTPMVVNQHASVIDDNSPIVRQYVVNDGVCGFATIIIKPATCSFAKWLKKNNLGRVSYYGGIAINVHQFNQSYERKMKYADAFAAVLQSHGITAYADGRLD